jgi:xanthine/CO dehydrogenase XdhC/CoxF family maturation factor
LKLDKLYSQIKSSLEADIAVSVITLMNPQNNNNTKLLIDSNRKISGNIDISDKITSVLIENVYKKMNTHAFSAIYILAVDKKTLAFNEYRNKNLTQDLEVDNKIFFLVELFYPKLKLIIVGGGHVGLALAQLADILEFEIIVVDDRKEYANNERFPMAKKIYSDKISHSLNSIMIDHLSYIVLVSRGHKLDEEALELVIEKNASYIGMIGSKRRTKIVLDNLLTKGISVENLEKVYTPVGLNLGGQSPGEIGLSILAEIVQLIHEGDGASLKNAQRLRE